MKKSVSLLATLLLLLPLLTLAADPRKTLATKSIDSKKNLPNSVETKTTEIGPLAGEYHPCKNVSGKYIQDLGKFSVDEHNKQTGDHLKYPEVYEAKCQIVAGTNYKLKLKATDGGLRRDYEAVVYVDLKKIPHLTSFVPIVH